MKRRKGLKLVAGTVIGGAVERNKKVRQAERWTGQQWRKIEFEKLRGGDHFRLREAKGNLWKTKGRVAWTAKEDAFWNEDVETWAVIVE